MKNLDDLSQKTKMLSKKIPPKIVKKDFHSNYSKRVVETPSIWDFTSKSIKIVKKDLSTI